MSRDYQFINVNVVDKNGAQLVALQPIAGQGSLTFDSTWAPYVQGTIVTAPPTAAELTKIDPRQGVRVTGTFRQVEIETGVVTSRPFDLNVRSRARLYAGDVGNTLSITVASDEALCQDYAGDQPFAPADNSGLPTSYIAGVALNFVFSNANNFTIVIEAGAPNPNLGTAAKSTWDAGTSAWDYMAAMAEGVGAWLYCDEQRIWHWAAPGWAADSSSHPISDATHIVTVTDTIDRTDAAFGNWAMVQYTGDNPVTQVSSDGGVMPRKALVVQRARKQPAGNAATRVRTMAQKRGRSLIVSAFAEVVARPNQSWPVTFQGVSWSATVQAVTFDLTNGLMALTLNVIEP